jgi:hypothetical protein
VSIFVSFAFSAEGKAEVVRVDVEKRAPVLEGTPLGLAGGRAVPPQ